MNTDEPIHGNGAALSESSPSELVCTFISVCCDYYKQVRAVPGVFALSYFVERIKLRA